MHSETKIIFAVVLYKVNVSDSSTLLSLTMATSYIPVSYVYIYDNGLKNQAKQAISLFSSQNIIVHYVHDPTNPGVSKAYNEAGKFAAKNNIAYLVLLDQDTQLTAAYFSELNKVLQNGLTPDLLVPKLQCNSRLISPTYFILGRFWQIKSRINGIQKIRWKTALNSGLVVSLKSFQQTGGYNEAFPLDLSDHVFIHEFKKRYSTFYIMSATLSHNLSVLTDRDEDKILNRYRMQRMASKRFSKQTGIFLHYFWSLLLGIRYCIRFKTLRFLTLTQ